jgi:uncharacterized membrane protein YhdT
VPDIGWNEATMRLVGHDQRPASRSRSRLAFWWQVAAAVGLLAIAALQASTMRGYFSWFAIMALAVTVLAAALTALCAVLTWRDLHDEDSDQL